MTEHISDKPKKAKDMSKEEREAAWAAIKRAERTPRPIPTDKMAKNMSDEEKRDFLDACRSRE
jgi:predicted Fe-S protein YdhL (DUF1289 family)